MHFDAIDRFDNTQCVIVCDSVKDQSIPNHYTPNAIMADLSAGPGLVARNRG